VSVALARA